MWQVRVVFFSDALHGEVMGELFSGEGLVEICCAVPELLPLCIEEISRGKQAGCVFRPA